MDWMTGLQRAIDYAEENLCGEIDAEEAARRAYSSAYHFQKVFGILCGISFGEYVRRRRLTRAGEELLGGGRVMDVALRYGYESPDGFSRAFYRFHGILPSEVKKGCRLRAFSRLTLQVNFTGGSEMNYKIEEKPELVLVGYGKRFSGAPFGEEREAQEDAFFRTTRAKQWLLRGASDTPGIDYCVVDRVDGEGYDFYIAYDLDDWSRQELYNPAVTGVDFMEGMGFETLVIPRRTYAVFATGKAKRPIAEYVGLRRRIVTEWLPDSGYLLADAPEVIVMHWNPPGREKERYIEIRMPVERIDRP